MINCLVSFIFFPMVEAVSMVWLILLNWSCSFEYSCAEFGAFPPATCSSSSLLGTGVFSLMSIHYTAAQLRTSGKGVATDDSL